MEAREVVEVAEVKKAEGPDTTTEGPEWSVGSMSDRGNVAVGSGELWHEMEDGGAVNVVRLGRQRAR
jgi:hypothetical protein